MKTGSPHVTLHAIGPLAMQIRWSAPVYAARGCVQAVNVYGQISYPLLTVLTILLALLMFVVAPLHAAGIIESQDIGLVVGLGVIAAVVFQQKSHSRRQVTSGVQALLDATC
jgi:hypothetical protein